MDDESLVLAAIERSERTWLSAASIASEAGLPLERALAALDASAAVIVEAALSASDPSAPPPGYSRYSTRAHYRAKTGLVRRYVDALLSS